MTTARNLIHSLVPSFPVLQPSIDKINRLFVIRNWHNDQILHVDLA